MSLGAGSKPCCICGVVKPLEEFARDSRKSTGRAGRCKRCDVDRWRERVARDPEAAAWRRASIQAHYRAHREAYLERNAARKSAQRRRPPWACRASVLSIYRTARWLRSLGLEIEVDHTVPLRGRTVCGLHNQHNLRLAFACQNRRKAASYWPHHLDPLPGQFVRLDGTAKLPQDAEP